MDFCLSYLNIRILKGFDGGMMTGMILIDLQKAFGTIDCDVLFQKLEILLVSLSMLLIGLSFISQIDLFWLI